MKERVRYVRCESVKFVDCSDNAAMLKVVPYFSRVDIRAHSMPLFLSSAVPPFPVDNVAVHHLKSTVLGVPHAGGSSPLPTVALLVTPR